MKNAWKMTWVLVSLLVLVTTTGAALAADGQAAPSATTLEESLVAETVPTESGGCAERLDGDLPDFVFANSKDNEPLCGSCSLDGCAGQQRSKICGFKGGQFGRCEPVQGWTCPFEQTWECSCYFAP